MNESNIDNIKINGEQKEKNSRLNNSKRVSFKLVIFLLIFALIAGVVGGVGGLAVLVNQDQGFLKKLGFSEEVSIPTTLKKEIVLEESSAIIDAVNKVRPSVVSIVAKERVRNLFGDVDTRISGGSGFIITSDGNIVTNKHVVGNENLSYEVYLNDGTKYNAKVLTRDPFNDLAILKIEADNLPVVEIGSSSDLKVGQSIIAVGNALGEFQNTVTYGVVSAKNRNLSAQGATGETENLEGLLQVDAAINQGNSGGPLANLDGQVVGINVAKAQMAENIGFAIPSSVLKTALESLNEYGKIVRPFLGVRYISVTPELAEKNNLSAKEGAIIYTGSLDYPAIVADSPASKAGLKERDIITKINDKKVSPSQSLSILLQNYVPGDTITITYLRDGEQREVEVKLARHDKF
jgi:S1-C subfamily serine protease